MGRRQFVVTFCLALGLTFIIDRQIIPAAEINVLDSFSPAVIEKHLAGLTAASASNVAILKQSLASYVAGTDMTSPKAITSSLVRLDIAAAAVPDARKGSQAVSDYLRSKRDYLSGRLSRYQSLADLNSRVEAPYYEAMDTFFALSRKFLSYTGTNFAAISEGSVRERETYEALYAEYSWGLEVFNAASDAYVHGINDFVRKNPEISEFLLQ